MGFLSQLINSEVENYTPKYFKSYELVDKTTYQKRLDFSYQLIDSRILWTIDKLREYFNSSIIINNWKFGGNREWSGFRTKESPYYSPYSQHTTGRAIDFIVRDVNSKLVREEIKNNINKDVFKYITAIEDFDGMDWAHIDCRNWNKKENGLLIFNK